MKCLPVLSLGQQGSYGCIKKTEEIWNRSQRCEAAESMDFLYYLGTYDVE